MKWAILGALGIFLGYEVLQAVKSNNAPAKQNPPRVNNGYADPDNGAPPRGNNKGGTNEYDVALEILKQGGNVFQDIWNKTGDNGGNEPGYSDPAYDDEGYAEYDFDDYWV